MQQLLLLPKRRRCRVICKRSSMYAEVAMVVVATKFLDLDSAAKESSFSSLYKKQSTDYLMSLLDFK